MLLSSLEYAAREQGYDLAHVQRQETRGEWSDSTSTLVPLLVRYSSHE
ncbi:hypothetical protein [Ktedonobacter racemifer]|uniref:Uncharacterized protein n=1 Tax=Ktedonobacter racemifer DSM 44963 TaxID=485913 RepID=D6TGR0_KTERA|nr:hypothetical protein [Ktedonobacter racemifer]EFH88839.1 hypothetical protein Krac_10341 [Ktedonobacter racemifer DSM 44963]